MNNLTDTPASEAEAPAPVVRAWWPGQGVLTVRAACHWLDSHQSATVEVQSQTLAPWRAALKSAVSRARLTEPLDPTGTRVTLTLELQPDDGTQKATPGLASAAGPLPPAAPGIGQGLAECAAVVADRAARSALHLPEAGAWVLASSGEWELGALHALPEPWQAQSLAWLRGRMQASPGGVDATLTTDPCVYIAMPHGLPEDAPARWRAVDHLDQLQGPLAHRPAPGRLVRSYEAWFPTIGARGAQLASVRVVVTPIDPDTPGAVEVLGTTDRDKIRRTHAVLGCVRRNDAHAARWRTLVHFSTAAFDGRSFELALAVADRIARGREWPGAGRVLATGAIDERTGAVLPVEESPPRSPFDRRPGAQAEDLAADGKLGLLQREVRLYDTVLLPQIWGTRRTGSGENGAIRHPLRCDHLPPSAPFARPQVLYLGTLTL